ncbi:esterase/lipase superfamily enzyme [Pseudomonas sp. WPR_5_2]|nr:esterase/lipase superfamily enzyme [Pseudomonas sp. WPR_5_2]
MSAGVPYGGIGKIDQPQVSVPISIQSPRPDDHPSPYSITRGRGCTEWVHFPPGEDIDMECALGAEDAFISVPVAFATDREKTGPSTFGATRASTISYGTVNVSIPRDHKMGKLEAPSWWRLRFEQEPEFDVMVLRTESVSSTEFFSNLRRDVSDSATKSLLVFVHGFNVSFQDAARRTAQMSYDLGFTGVPAFFSWPSQDQLLSYSADEQAIIDAEPHLQQFLRDVLRQSDAESIYLIAHSMGNRGLTHALMALARTDPKEVKRIKEVILAAPDIGTIEFTEQIAPGLQKLGAPITLYASSNDRALATSKWLHGGARAGESGENLIVVNGIETIDASNTDTDLIGHSYYGDRRSVLADMWYLINGELPAAKRCCLQGEPSRIAPKYWVFLK